MIKWFASHPTAANLLLIIIIAVGLFSVPELKRETFPDSRPVEVSVDVVYKGASAIDVEESVCTRLYDAVKSVEFLKEFTCTAQDNIATSIATMDAGGNAIRFLNQVQTEAQSIQDLPSNTEPPVVRELNRTDLVNAIAVTSRQKNTIFELEDYALKLEKKLMRVPGVSEVSTRGISQRQWQIEIQKELLRQYGIDARKLGDIIRSQNIDLPLGTLETDSEEISLRFTEQRKVFEDLGSITIVADDTGAELTLSDIAIIKLAEEDVEEKVTFNGKRAIILEVSKSKSSDSLTVKQLVSELIDTENQNKESNFSLSVTQDMTSIVEDRLQMLAENGIMGLALVVIVMSLFYRPRLALWAVLGLPVSFMGAFFVMSVTGMSLNMITTVGLLMAIGIVMDDAIVITDSVVTKARPGESALKAAYSGTLQVFSGVLSSFLTTVAVFLPLAFLSGEMGAVLEVLPVALLGALTASLIEAFFILPHHLKSSLSADKGKESKIRKVIQKKFDHTTEWVADLAASSVNRRYWVLSAVIFVSIFSVGYMAGGNINNEAMPDIDGDVLQARVLMPAGTPLGRTEEVINKVVSSFKEIDSEYEKKNNEKLLVSLQERYNYNPTAKESGSHVATVVVDLLTAEKRNITLDEIIERWKGNIGDIHNIEQLIIQEPGFGPAGIPVEIRLSGSDFIVLKQASNELKSALRKYDAIYNVSDNLHYGQTQKVFTVDKGAFSLGLSAQDIASQLRAGLLGESVDTIRVGNNEIEVLVRQSVSDRDSVDDLETQFISLKDGSMVPLSTVTNVKETRSWSQINHVNGLRTVTVTANVDARLSTGQTVVSDLTEHWIPSFEKRYPEIELGIEGQVARSQETGQSIGQQLLIGLIGIFVILSFQFKSYTEPFIVMLSIPLALLGALWGHVLMGYYISMPSMIGAASLSGIVVNNSILLIQHIKSGLESGQDVYKACVEASRARFRPIIISSSTTIMGLLPLLAETSTQAIAIKPLVISVVFGLLTSTVLVILVIPPLYTLLFEWKNKNVMETSN